MLATFSVKVTTPTGKVYEYEIEDRATYQAEEQGKKKCLEECQHLRKWQLKAEAVLKSFN